MLNVGIHSTLFLLSFSNINVLRINVCMQVIEYVQYLQEKVQKHEGSYQGWSPEPTKLMPWVISSSSLPF